MGGGSRPVWKSLDPLATGIWGLPRPRVHRQGPRPQGWGQGPHSTDHILLACHTLTRPAQANLQEAQVTASAAPEAEQTGTPQGLPQTPTKSQPNPKTVKSRGRLLWPRLLMGPLSPSPRPHWALSQGQLLPARGSRSKPPHLLRCHRQNRLPWEEGREVSGVPRLDLTRQGGEEREAPREGPGQDQRA